MMRKAVCSALVALALAGCGGPEAGELVIDLTTPNNDDGAIQFTITATPGKEVASVTAACTGCQVFTRSVSVTELRGIITGPITRGSVLRVTVSDIGKPEAYTARVLQVASRSYDLRSTTAGYRFTITE